VKRWRSLILAFSNDSELHAEGSVPQSLPCACGRVRALVLGVNLGACIADLKKKRNTADAPLQFPFTQ
jgi:hypothetical protein